MGFYIELKELKKVSPAKMGGGEKDAKGDEEDVAQEEGIYPG